MNKKSLILLFSIVLLGAVLRVIFFGFAPPALNIDEAALGYNAYSLLKTGADEHGRFLPLSLESFGDWKLPVYSYITVIPVWILGLNEFSTRVPSILAGILAIPIIYLVSQKLFNKKEISLFTSFFIAVSPWSIYFSRAAYEVNVATTIFLAGFLSLLYGISGKHKKIFLTFSGVLFGLTLFTYHSYVIFSTLFATFLLFYYFKSVKFLILFFLIPFLIFLTFSFYSNIFGASIKATTTTVFSDENILYERVNKFRKDTVGDNISGLDLIHTKYVGIPYHISQNYINSFSPTFHFDTGGEKLVHNTVGFGNLYLMDIIFISFGIIMLFVNKIKTKVPIFTWLLLAPIPSSITLDHPNSTRLFILMPVFVLISGYGVWCLLERIKKMRLGKIIFFLICGLYVINIYYFLNLYFIHMPYHRAQFWRVGYKEVVQVVSENHNKPVVMQGLYDFPYIYFLFYSQYDPQKFQEEVVYYPTTKEGFKYVKEFGRFHFVHALADINEAPNTLYIDNQNFHKNDNVITLPNGDPIFKYYEKND